MADLTDAEIIAKADGLRALMFEKAGEAVLDIMAPFASDPSAAIGILATCLGVYVRSTTKPTLAAQGALAVFHGVISGKLDK